MQLEDVSLAGVGESQRQWCSTGSCSCNPASACPKPWGETGRQNPLKRIPNFCRWQAGKPKKKGKYIVWAAEGITYFPFYLERKINWKKKTKQNNPTTSFKAWKKNLSEKRDSWKGLVEHVLFSIPHKQAYCVFYHGWPGCRLFTARQRQGEEQEDMKFAVLSRRWKH